MVEAVGIIPARYDSKRLPGKPLALIQDRPMIQHVYERAARAASLQRLVLATDDSRIQKAVARFGGEVLMTSGDHKSGTDRVAEAARQLMLSDDTIVVNIQGDEPLLRTEMIDSLVDTLKAKGEVDMATLAHPGTDSNDFHDPAVVKVVLDSEGRALYFSRTPIPTMSSGLPRRHLLGGLGSAPRLVSIFAADVCRREWGSSVQDRTHTRVRARREGVQGDMHTYCASQ